MPRALIVGGSGFVGRHLAPALSAAGVQVRATSRSPQKWSERCPEVDWIRLDVADPAGFPAALQGCRYAYFLVHQLGSGADYPEQEAEAARAFAAAAEEAGVERIVYLGGIQPVGRISRHLGSRLSTGKILRAGPVPTIELRAAMIIGADSQSWQIVWDLAERLPAMVLPSWLDYQSCPIDILDVVYALVASLGLSAESQCWDIPGPETMSHRRCLERAAGILGRKPPMVRVPIVSPSLSSYWIAMVTRAQLSVTRELVEGLRADLRPTIQHLWPHVPTRRLVDFETAARTALAEDKVPNPSAEQRERLSDLGQRLSGFLGKSS